MKKFRYYLFDAVSIALRIIIISLCIYVIIYINMNIGDWGYQILHTKWARGVSILVFGVLEFIFVLAIILQHIDASSERREKILKTQRPRPQVPPDMPPRPDWQSPKAPPMPPKRDGN